MHDRYIIDHYNNLPDVMVFMHSERYQWHNDDPIYGIFFFYYLISK